MAAKQAPMTQAATGTRAPLALVPLAAPAGSPRPVPAP